MENYGIFMRMIAQSINEMNDTIDRLYTTCNSCTKNMLLNRLRKSLTNLSMLIKEIQNNINKGNSSTVQEAERVFTPDELARYNGKDGQPAYVTVNTTVYDVTNNAAWAAATHFGLIAGRDLTNEFASCHAGQPILSRLKVVGKMA